MIMGSPPPRYLVPCTPQLLTLTGQSCTDLDPWGRVAGAALGHPEYSHFHGVAQDVATSTSGPVYSANHHGADLPLMSPVTHPDPSDIVREAHEVMTSWADLGDTLPSSVVARAGDTQFDREIHAEDVARIRDAVRTAMAGDVPAAGAAELYGAPTRPGESTGRHALTERIDMTDDQHEGPQPCPGGHGCPDPDNHVDGFPCAPAVPEPPREHVNRRDLRVTAHHPDEDAPRRYRCDAVEHRVDVVPCPNCVPDMSGTVCRLSVPGTGGGVCTLDSGHRELCGSGGRIARQVPPVSASGVFGYGHPEATQFHPVADDLDPAHTMPANRDPARCDKVCAGGVIPDDYAAQDLPEILRHLNASVHERVDEHEALRHQVGLALAREGQQRRAAVDKLTRLAGRADERAQRAMDRVAELDARERPDTVEMLESGRDPWQHAQSVALVILALCAVMAVVGGLLF